MDTQTLLIEEMKDQYDAEKQLVKALPGMVKASSNPELSAAFKNHLEETKIHVQRLEQAFELLGEKAKSKTCEAMKGLIVEAKKTIGEDMEADMHDSAIIAIAQKIEHYEIAGYGTLCAWASSIGLVEVSELLQQTLEEEKLADSKLTEVAEAVIGSSESGPVTKKTSGGRRHKAVG